MNPRRRQPQKAKQPPMHYSGASEARGTGCKIGRSPLPPPGVNGVSLTPRSGMRLAPIHPRGRLRSVTPVRLRCSASADPVRRGPRHHSPCTSYPQSYRSAGLSETATETRRRPIMSRGTRSLWITPMRSRPEVATYGHSMSCDMRCWCGKCAREEYRHDWAVFRFSPAKGACAPVGRRLSTSYPPAWG